MKQFVPLLLIFLFLLTMIPSGAAVSHTLQILTGVPYCSPSGTPLLMDLYLPISSTPTPIVVDIHGGAWVSGNRSDSWALAMYPLLNAKGIAMASIDYRLAPKYVFPAQIEDVACAVRFLRANAAAYNLNPSQIGAFGDSSGGHLALLLGYTNGGTIWPNDGEWANYSSSINAIVDWFGPTLLTQTTDFPPQEVKTDITETFGSNQSTLIAASPMTYVTSTVPPTLIMHGQKDGVVAIHQSIELNTALQNAGVTAKQFTQVSNAGHSWVHVGWPWQLITPSVPTIEQTSANWFAAHL